MLIIVVFQLSSKNLTLKFEYYRTQDPFVSTDGQKTKANLQGSINLPIFPDLSSSSNPGANNSSPSNDVKDSGPSLSRAESSPGGPSASKLRENLLFSAQLELTPLL